MKHTVEHTVKHPVKHTLEPTAEDAAATPAAPCPRVAAPAAEPAATEPCPTDGTPPAWRSLFSGTPREILGRIVRDDPLGVRAIVADELASGGWLLDADRVQLRALARCARIARGFRGRPALRAWLEEIVRGAIQELVREDGETLRGGRPFAMEEGSAFDLLARPLGLGADSMRRACAQFNRMPTPDRAAFLALVVRARTLDEVARDCGESATEVARRARRALEVFLHAAGREP